jgi:uncharacterized protein YjbI with pentapeptide repeats
MKIYKKKEIGLFLRPIGVRGRIYLSAAAMLFFDLDNPDVLLKEKEMWTSLQDVMGEKFVLDQGAPKAHPELLITGSCFAPAGETRKAERVRVKVGSLEKSLDVFGDRWFGPGGSIAEPEPFTEMEISLANAFGGPDVAENPYGKGAVSIALSDGRRARPLPNVEAPGHLMGAPDDRPKPAAFGPLPVDIPPRSKRSGTFDEAWKRERWPYFPEDFDFGHYNAAPEDQWAGRFFEAGEAVEVENMHPERRRIESRLSTVKPRLFVTRRSSLKAGEAEEVFVETSFKLETVWLFPGILRGLVLYRGMTEILDDEYADVVRLFMTLETADQQPGSLEHYRDESLKAATRRIPSQAGPVEAGAEERKKADMMLAKLPQLVQMAKLKVLGKAPMAPSTPEECLAKGSVGLDKAEETLDHAQAKMAELKAQFGHLARIEPSDLERFRQDIQEGRSAVKEASQSFKAAAQEADKVKSEASAFLKENADPATLEKLRKGGLDPEDLAKPPSVNPWHDRGFPLVMEWRRALERDPGVLTVLESLGLSRLGAELAWLGYIPEPLEERPADWGMDGDGVLTLPSGLVMPRFTDKQLTSIRIRPGREARELSDGSKDVFAQGSLVEPLFIEGPKDAPVVAVEDELEARVLADQAGDLCSVLVLASPAETPPGDAVEVLKSAVGVYKALPAGSKADASDWEAVLPGVKPLVWPEGAHVLDAHRQGVDLRDVLDELWPAVAGEAEAAPGLGAKRPDPTAGLGLDGVLAEVEAFVKSKIPGPPGQGVAGFEKVLLGTAAQHLRESGVENPEAVLEKLASQPAPGLAESGREAAAEYEALARRLQSIGELESGEEAGLAQAAQGLKISTAQAEGKFAAMGPKMEAMRKELEAKQAQGGKVEIPENMKEEARKAGLDPDKLLQHTREDVERLLSQGESLAGRNLTKVDLSGLDLSGQDFYLTLLEGANLKGCRLDGAVFKMTMAQGADLTGASLKGADLLRALFLNAVMPKVDFSGAKLNQTMLKKADLTGADFRGARLELTALEGAILDEADFSNSTGKLCAFSRARAAHAKFRGARLERCLFKSVCLDGADFSKATLPSTIFTGEGCGGESVSFAGANLDKFRMGQGNAMPEADFTGASLRQAYCKGANLSGANFDAAVLDEAMFEECDLTLANLRRVPARKARFNRCNLEHADMRSVNLMLGALRKSRLVACDLTASNLFGVDVFKAVFGKTGLDRAVLTRTLIDKRTDLIK